MEISVAIVAILGAVLLGAMSPGPSFVLVVRTAVAMSRGDALAVAAGMGSASIGFAAAALLGLHVVLSAVPALYAGLKIAGAAYLLYLAVALWRGASARLDVGDAGPQQRATWRSSFLLGLATQLSNPKTAIVYASIFTALLPADTPTWLGAVLLPAIFVIETAWYAVVALAFSSEVPRRSYLRWKLWIDRTAGAFMGALAGKLAWEARP